MNFDWFWFSVVVWVMTFSCCPLFLLRFQGVLFINFVLSLLVDASKPYEFSPDRKTASS